MAPVIAITLAFHVCEYDCLAVIRQVRRKNRTAFKPLTLEPAALNNRIGQNIPHLWIIAYDPYFAGEPGPAKLVSLEFLMKNSDIISMHARLTKESYHLIGEKELTMMKPSAVLVNTARSGLVDECALARALEEKRIAGAALDVFDAEPLPADHPFIRLENATITAHLAGSTIDSFINSPKLMAGHLRDCLTGCKDIPIINNIQPSLKARQDR